MIYRTQLVLLLAVLCESDTLLMRDIWLSYLHCLQNLNLIMQGFIHGDPILGITFWRFLQYCLRIPRV